MGLKNRISPNGIYFLTTTVIEWVDVFSRQVYRDIIIESLKYCQKDKGLILYSWCLMSNHLHWIASAEEGFNLSDIIRILKNIQVKKLLKK